MGSLVRLLWIACLAAALAPGATFSFHVIGDDPGPWPRVLSSVGLVDGAHDASTVYVVRQGTPDSGVAWKPRVENGAFLILEGESAAASSFGFRPTAKRVQAQSVVDLRSPKLPIIWEKPLGVPAFTLPAEARLFARERWQSAPLLAGMTIGKGGVLWVASSPGKQGHERYPYLLQALGDLGFRAPFQSSRLWAFFDAGYRSRVDLDYFAERWQKAGIGALHVAAWHYFEPNAERDAYLKTLIEACHKRAILVYAWVELPHVSEEFWRAHPEWREQTALQQDAQLDWRKLMNLQNRDCFREAAKGTQTLLDRFDWDGVNLAELYFESLEGADNPARFTPLNGDVRREFAQKAGFDPLTLFGANAAAERKEHPERLTRFLTYRAELTRRMQAEWMAEMQKARQRKPDLDLVLTHVDDRYDTRMRELIGADASRVLPMLEQQDFTFLIEDPATIWNLGPERYPQIAGKYEPLTKRVDRLAIDINVVDRYQDVYPTKQQTGTELFSLIHSAAQAFPRVALYFENSIPAVDWTLLPSAAAVATRVEPAGNRLVVESPSGLGVPWEGPALVDGRAWPVSDGQTVWLPAGAHVVSPAQEGIGLRLLRLNGELRTAMAAAHGVSFGYESQSRSIALVDRKPVRVEVDGAPVEVAAIPSGKNFALLLPRGQHIVAILSD